MIRRAKAGCSLGHVSAIVGVRAVLLRELVKALRIGLLHRRGVPKVSPPVLI
jgi:hypothetical protein